MFGISISLTFILVIHIHCRTSQALICLKDDGHREGDRFPITDNCLYFSECVGYEGGIEPVDFPCLEGTHFSVHHNVCVHPDLALCADELRNLTCVEEDQRISHPSNCSRYFKCNEANSRPTVVECPDHLHFSKQEKECVDAGVASCDESLQCTIFDDPSRPTLLAHPSNCEAFYKCFNGRPIPLLCPTNLYFSAKKQYCDFPFNVDCRMGVGRNMF